MFTGLIEEVGTIQQIVERNSYHQIGVKASANFCREVKIGDSIAIDGVCQTVVSLQREGFTVEALKETLKKTTFNLYRKGQQANLERAATVNSRFDGHIVQGHVSCTGKISAIKREKSNIYLKIVLPKEQLRYMSPEGSVALDGVSLTIAKREGHSIVANIIPHTWEKTTLSSKREGHSVNVESDITARILLNRGDREESSNKEGLTESKLKAWGF